jgi:hypothetical protein
MRRQRNTVAKQGTRQREAALRDAHEQVRCTRPVELVSRAPDVVRSTARSAANAITKADAARPRPHRAGASGGRRALGRQQQKRHAGRRLFAVLQQQCTRNRCRENDALERSRRYAQTLPAIGEGSAVSMFVVVGGRADTRTSLREFGCTWRVRMSLVTSGFMNKFAMLCTYRMSYECEVERARELRRRQRDRNDRG